MNKLVIGVLLAQLAVPAYAQDIMTPFQGLWGVSDAECNDREGPNYNTIIEGDIFMQYENTCQITKMSGQGPGVVLLSLSCDTEGEKTEQTAKLTMTVAGKMLLEHGKSVQLFQKCPVKADTKPETKVDILPRCGDEDVLDTVTAIAKKSGIVFYKENEKKFGDMQLLPTIKYRAVTTLKPTDNNRGYHCRAAALISYDDKKSKETYAFLLKEAKRQKDRKFLERLSSSVGERYWEWIVMLSDDGKDIHVQIVDK